MSLSVTKTLRFPFLFTYHLLWIIIAYKWVTCKDNINKYTLLLLPILHFKFWNGIGFILFRFMSLISFQTLKWNRFEMHREKSTIDSWFSSPWNDRTKIPIKTHVRFTDETTVQNLQKSAWLFFVRFYRHEICRKARGRFLFISNDLKFAEKRMIVFRSRRPKNDRSKIRRKARVVFWSFHR